MSAPTDRQKEVFDKKIVTSEPGPRQHGLLKLAFMQIAAGGCAGFVEVSLMHPLDLVKTRFQIQRGADDLQRYKSLADCFRRIYAQEGIISFYKGILPPILAETPKRATKFFTFEQYKKLWSFGAPAPSGWGLTMAGLFAGLTEAIVINPFEVVKVTLQSQREVNLLQQKSAYATMREIVHSNGLGFRGLNKGLTATLGRHGVWNMIYFSFYHNIKDAFPHYEDARLEFCRKFAIGLAAGTIASTVNIPFDVAKSRIQGPQPVVGEVKYRACFQTMNLVYKEEGALALFKGWVPKIMRLGPGGAIMLLVFEHVYEFLKKSL